MDDLLPLEFSFVLIYALSSNKSVYERYLIDGRLSSQIRKVGFPLTSYGLHAFTIGQCVTLTKKSLAILQSLE